MEDSIGLEIGGFRCRAHAASPDVRLFLAPELRPFAASDGPWDLSFLVKRVRPHLPAGLVLRFASSGVWHLYTGNGSLWLSFTLPGAVTPYRVASLDLHLSHGELQVEAARAANPVDPWEYPLSELLVVFLLAEGRGVLLHASALVDRGEACLFVGESGAGKSTMTRLWAGSGVHFLSDDRTILRRHGTRCWAYGTPWHGDAGVASPGKAPLGKLFFLQKAAGHAVRPLAPREGLTRLLVNCFPTFWDPDGMAFTLGFLAQLVQEIPCYELAFSRDAGVVDVVRSIRD